eukprot:4566936-Pyramimonas_sp.AAC.2
MAAVCNVEAHRSLGAAASGHEEWLIKGNALADDKWAKRGARLRNVSQDHLDFVSGCERIASDIVKWQSGCHE